MNSPNKSKDGPQLRNVVTVKPKNRKLGITVTSVEGDDTAQTAAPIDLSRAPTVDTTLADTDNRYLRISSDQLPSKGLFYEYTALSIKKFAFPSLKKIARAKATQSFRTLVEVINESIDRDIMELTTGDFWYLMYWHRINSYLTAPLDITFKCTNAAHLMCTTLPNSDEMYKSPETLTGYVTLQKSNMKVVYIENEELLSKHIRKVFEATGLTLFPTRMKDLVENVEMMDKLAGVEAFKEHISENADKELETSIVVTMAEKVSNNVDEEWLNDNASLLHDIHGNTLEDKRDFLLTYTEQNNIGYELIQYFEEFLDLTEHGVRESVETKCKECGAVAEGIISAQALNFFP